MKYVRLSLWLAVVLVLAPSAHAQSRRLNAPLPRPGAADVQPDLALSGDGSRLVFRADLLVDETIELYSSPADASGPPVRLNAPLVPGGDVVRFALAGRRAVYLADQDEDEVFELYVVRLRGSSALDPGPPHAQPHPRVSGPLVEGGDVLSFLLTPDGTSVVFLADALADERQEFFLVPLDGSAPRQALDPAPETERVTNSWMAPDGGHVLYTRREITRPSQFQQLHQERLYSLALDGSPDKVLIAEAHPPLDTFALYGRSFTRLEFSADGQRAVYADQIDGKDGPEEARLNSAAVDGSQPPIVLSQGPSNQYYDVFFTLSASLGRAVFFELGNAYSIALDGTGRVQLDPGGWSPSQPCVLTPDGNTVLFHARSAAMGGLLSARVDGSQPTVVLDGPGSFVVNQITPSDTRAFYAARQGFLGFFTGFSGLWGVALGGGTRQLLNGPPFERTGATGSLTLTPAGDLLFKNSFSIHGVSELYAVPGDGSLPPRLVSAPMSGGRDVAEVLLAPDGEGVVYRADQVFDGAFEPFRASVSGAAPPRAFLDLPVGPVVGDVLDFQVIADGRSVVFKADQDTDEEFRLYRVDPLGRASPTRVGQYPLDLGAYPTEYAFAPGGDRLVRFKSTLSSYLYAVGTAPESSEVSLDYGRVSGPLRFTPDAARAIYLNYDGFYPDELMSLQLDGSSATTLYRVPDSDVFDPQLTPDGSTVVFRAGTSSAQINLLRVPVLGGPAVRLNPSFATNRTVTAFRITPDGASAVYLADQRSNDVFELFVVPLDGSRQARRLSGVLVSLGDVLDFVLTPDGQRVVYRADALVNGSNELFSAPLAPSARDFERVRPGSEPDVVRLTTLGGSAQPDYRIALDGAQVFFRGGAAQSPALFRVPLLGGQAPERLSQPDGTRVHSFELSSDKVRVVYLADRRGAGVDELFSVGTLGGPVTELDPLPAFADVSVYRLSGDARHAVYLCDRRLDGMNELLRVPLDGSAPAEPLSDRLPAGGDVQPDFAILPDGAVVYRADQEADEVFELFVAAPAPR